MRPTLKKMQREETKKLKAAFDRYERACLILDWFDTLDFNPLDGIEFDIYYAYIEEDDLVSLPNIDLPAFRGCEKLVFTVHTEEQAEYIVAHLQDVFPGRAIKFDPDDPTKITQIRLTPVWIADKLYRIEIHFSCNLLSDLIGPHCWSESAGTWVVCTRGVRPSPLMK